jgi:hypothetical protein
MTLAVNETKHVTYLVMCMCMCDGTADEQMVDWLICLPYTPGIWDVEQVKVEKNIMFGRQRKNVLSSVWGV